MQKIERRRMRASRSRSLLETLESRTLMSTSYAVMVMDAPRTTTQQPTQVDQPAVPGPVNPGSPLASALDLQVRVVAGGIYLTVAASSTVFSDLAPTGAVDFYDGGLYLGSVNLGESFRNATILSPGSHDFFVVYNGDSNFTPSLTSIFKVLDAPTNVLPADPALQTKHATNTGGKRVRPMRFLSNIDFFDGAGITVGAIPPSPVPQVPGDTTPPAQGGATPGSPIPNPRFSKVSFSVKVPKLARP